MKWLLERAQHSITGEIMSPRNRTPATEEVVNFVCIFVGKEGPSLGEVVSHLHD